MATAPFQKRWHRGGLALATLLAIGGCGGTTRTVSGEPAPGERPTIEQPVVTPGDPAVEPARPAQPTDPAQPTAPAGPAARVAFVADPAAAALSPIGEASIFDTAQLWIVADWTGAPADGAEEVVVTAPGGSLYQSTQISFGETTRGDVRVQVLPDGTRRVALAFQIWGTSIEQLTRQGSWSAAVTLAGGDAGGSASVQLRE